MLFVVTKVMDLKCLTIIKHKCILTIMFIPLSLPVMFMPLQEKQEKE